MSKADRKLALCPYAAVWGCHKCPVKRVCPGKTTIGDQPIKPKKENKAP